MASKETVTPDNLAVLGAERLAAILVELADDDADVKRRLRLELAATGRRRRHRRRDRQAPHCAQVCSVFRRLAEAAGLRARPRLQQTMIADRVAATRAHPPGNTCDGWRRRTAWQSGIIQPFWPGRIDVLCSLARPSGRSRASSSAGDSRSASCRKPFSDAA
jgi:hypothetical protein